MRNLITCFTIIGLMLAGCSILPGYATLTPNSATSTSSPAQPQATAIPSDSLKHILLWVEARFAPDPETPAGTLLIERIAAFENDHPGVKVDLRVKEHDGPASLLETLAAAKTAAPTAAPDLITLDPESLTNAILKGLIAPLEDLIEEPTEHEWYPYAISAANLDQGFYGLPFASEVEAFAYRADRYSTAPYTWADLISASTPFLFPAGDPTANFTLTQYLNLGGPLFDQDGRPTLDPALLAEVFSFYGSAQSAAVLPTSVTQYQSSSETWMAFHKGQAGSTVAPFSNFLDDYNPNLEAMIPLPTRNGTGVVMSKTWSWAMVSQDSDHQELTCQLLDWLMAPDFLGPWTYALSLLPVTKSSLSAWPNGDPMALASHLIAAAQPRPSAEVFAIFGPPIQSAIESILEGSASPQAAALEVAQRILGP